jgi:hypothetical protein
LSSPSNFEARTLHKTRTPFDALHCANDCSGNPFCRRSRKKIGTESPDSDIYRQNVPAAHTVALIFFKKYATVY